MTPPLYLGVESLSVSSGTYVRNDIPNPAVSIELHCLNRHIHVGMTSNEARAMASLLCEQADRAETVTRAHSGMAS